MTYLHAAGKRLADELRRARAVGSTIEVVMVHENDQERGGCEFGILFDGRTPQDLLQGGIYNVRAYMLPSPAILAFSMRLRPYLGACLASHTGTRAGALLWAVLAGLGRAGGQGDWRDHRRLVLTRQQLHDSVGIALCGQPRQQGSWLSAVKIAECRRVPLFVPGPPPHAWPHADGLHPGARN